MGVQFDLIIPPIIAGMIILILFRVNAFMLDTSVDNRLGFEMQNFAESTADLIQSEVRLAKGMKMSQCKNSTCSFKTTTGDSVIIFQNDTDLNIERIGTSTTVNTYASRLDSLKFDFDGSGDMLRFRIVTKSNPDQEVGADDGQRVRGFSERHVFLRNVAYIKTQ